MKIILRFNAYSRGITSCNFCMFEYFDDGKCRPNNTEYQLPNNVQLSAFWSCQLGSCRHEIIFWLTVEQSQHRRDIFRRSRKKQSLVKNHHFNSSVVPRVNALNLKIIFIGEHQIEYSLCFLVFSLGLQIWSHSTIYLVSLSMYLMVSRFGSREYF